MGKFGQKSYPMKNLLLLFALLFSISCYSQCTVKDIFPFENNITKFNAIIASKKVDFLSYSEHGKYSFGSWEYIDYLKDSVYKDTYWFTIKNNKCFPAWEGEFSLQFCDDKLYKQTIKIEFDSNSFDDCMKVYKNIISVLQPLYKLSSNFVTTRKSSNEQIGEGKRFTNKVVSEYKFNEMTVQYEIEYEGEWNDYLKKYIERNNIVYYNITVQWTDLTQVKIDGHGY